jgi:transcriptional regulator with XRE-family HTH domain
MVISTNALIEHKKQPTTQTKQVRFSTQSNCLLWTKNGLNTLGQLVKESRLCQGLSQEEAIKLINEKLGAGIAPSKTTLSNLENSVGNPQYNTIAAITGAGLIIDINKEPYSILEVLSIASEKIIPKFPEMKTIKEMIEECENTNKISMSRIKSYIKNHNKYISERRINTIKNGIDIPTTQELMAIREIYDPEEEIFNEEQWLIASKRDSLLRQGKNNLL